MNEHEIALAVQQARQRDPQALAALCTHYYPKVLKYMRYRIGANDASDLTGEVFVRMIRGVDRQKGTFVAWLYAIAARVVVDHFRANGRRREVPIDGQAFQAASPAGDPARNVGRRLDLEQAVAQLTDDQRELIALKFSQGLSTGEVAKLMGRSPGAVRILQFRALSALRQILEGSGGAA